MVWGANPSEAVRLVRDVGSGGDSEHFHTNLLPYNLDVRMIRQKGVKSL